MSDSQPYPRLRLSGYLMLFGIFVLFHWVRVERNARVLREGRESANRIQALALKLWAEEDEEEWASFVFRCRFFAIVLAVLGIPAIIWDLIHHVG